MIRHIVMYQFRDDLTPAEVQEVIDAFIGLPLKVPNVIGFEWGTNVSNEGKSEGLTHAFVLTFPDAKALGVYIDHPAHQEFVTLVRQRRSKVVVFDFEIPF